MAEQKAENGGGSTLEFGDGSPCDRRHRWVAPPVGALKMNFHGVYARGNCRAGIAVLVRDHGGQLVDGVSLRMTASSSIEADAKAAAKAAELAQLYSGKKIIFEGETELLIKSVEACSVVNANWVIFSLVEGIKAECKSIGDFSWVVCNKRNNLAAAHIASMLTETDVFSDLSWISTPPPSWIRIPRSHSKQF